MSDTLCAKKKQLSIYNMINKAAVKVIKEKLTRGCEAHIEAIQMYMLEQNLSYSR